LSSAHSESDSPLGLRLRTLVDIPPAFLLRDNETLLVFPFLANQPNQSIRNNIRALKLETVKGRVLNILDLETVHLNGSDNAFGTEGVEPVVEKSIAGCMKEQVAIDFQQSKKVP